MLNLATHRLLRLVFFFGSSVVFVGGVAGASAYLTVRYIASEEKYKEIRQEITSRLPQPSFSLSQKGEEDTPSFSLQPSQDDLPVTTVPFYELSTDLLALIGGEGINIEGNKISNTGVKELTAGDGITVEGNKITNNDRGGSQSMFKHILVNNQPTIHAANNNDQLSFEAGSGISLSTDTTTKTLTISSTGAGATGGWNTSSSVMSPSTTTNDVVLGGTTSLGKLTILGDSNERQLVIRGASGQSNPLLQLQNNSGSVLAAFNSSGALSIAENQGITLTANNISGSVTRLLTLKATTAYDRPWISSVDHTGRHVVTYGALDTNHDGMIHKRFELKTVGAAGGSQSTTLLTRLAIDYDRDLADIIFGQVDSLGVHNNYGDRIKMVHQMRDSANTGSYVIGQWISELGAADSTIMTIDPKTLNATTDATLRFFRETNTSGQRRIVLYKGDATSTESIILNAGTGIISALSNSESLRLGDGSNVSSFVNFQSNRAMVGYDGSSAVLQSGINKNLKLNVNNSSFGSGTALTILSTGEVGIGLTDPGSKFQVNGSAAIGYSSSTAAPSNGLAVSGSVGIGTNSALSELEIRNATSPEIRLSKSTTTYFKLESTTTGAKIADIAATGEALLDFDPITSDGTSKSSVRLFRNVNTTNTATGFSIYAADNTSSVQSFFGAKGNSYFNILSGNFGIGTSSFGSSAVKVLALGNGTAPTTSIVDGVQLFAVDFNSGDGTATSELRVRDEDGNVTTLSPHNFSIMPDFSQEDLDWAYYSEKGDLAINANMAEALRKIEQLTGEQLIYIKNTQTGEYVPRTIPSIARTLAAEPQQDTRYEEVMQKMDELMPKSELSSYATLREKMWTFIAEVVFQNKVRFNGQVKVAGELQVGAQNTGTFTVPKGAKQVKVTFPTRFEKSPQLFVTPLGDVSGVMVTRIEADYFIVKINESIDQDFNCNWLAMVGEVAGSSVEVLEVDGSKQTVIETTQVTPTPSIPEENNSVVVSPTPKVASTSGDTQ